MSNKFETIRLQGNKMTPEIRFDRFKKFLNDNIKDLSKFYDDSIDGLLTWLKNETDFFSSPSSCIYHGNHEGGLFTHTMNVINRGLKIYEEIEENPTDEMKDSIILTCLCHDFCKLNSYVIDTKNTKKNGQWVSVNYLKKDYVHCLGHGEASLFLAGKFIDFTLEEAQAIRWHMSSFETGAHFWETKSNFDKALENPLLKIILIADQWSSFFSEKIIKQDV